MKGTKMRQQNKRLDDIRALLEKKKETINLDDRQKEIEDYLEWLMTNEPVPPTKKEIEEQRKTVKEAIGIEKEIETHILEMLIAEFKEAEKVPAPTQEEIEEQRKKVKDAQGNFKTFEQDLLNYMIYKRDTSAKR